MNRLKLNIRYTVKEGDAGKKVRIPANITEALGEAKFAKSNNELEFVLPKHAKVGKIIELAAPDGDIIRCVCAPKGNNTSHMMMCWCMSTFFMFIVISSLIINVYNPLSLSSTTLSSSYMVQAGEFAGTRVRIPAPKPRKKVITTKFVIPYGVMPGALIQIQNPFTKEQCLYKLPMNAQPGVTIEIRFEEKIKPKKEEFQIITVKMPKMPGIRSPTGGIPRKTPDGRRIYVRFPAYAQGGEEYQVKVPNNYSKNPFDLSIIHNAAAHFDESLYPNGDADVIEASLHIGLTFDELVLVVWRKKDTIFSADMPVIGPAIFQFIDSKDSGALTLDEFVAAMNNRAIVEFVESIGCPILNRLFHSNPKKQKRAFETLDTDKSGDISLDEWKTFLAKVQRDRLLFYRQQFLLKDIVYLGMGMEPQEYYKPYCSERNCGVRERERVCVCCRDRGREREEEVTVSFLSLSLSYHSYMHVLVCF
jgi:hypothetical protein